MNFSQSLSSIPDRFPVKVFPEIGVTVTGDLLRRNSALCAAWLQGQGCEAIGIHMANCPEFLYLFVFLQLLDHWSRSYDLSKYRSFYHLI